jgi:hypothetical protein
MCQEYDRSHALPCFESVQKSFCRLFSPFRVICTSNRVGNYSVYTRINLPNCLCSAGNIPTLWRYFGPSNGNGDGLPEFGCCGKIALFKQGFAWLPYLPLGVFG